MIRPGEAIETAMWVDGRETPAQRAQYETDLRQAFLHAEDHFGVVFGDVMFIEKRPGDERVPDVPDHIDGPDVRLLVAEATALRKKKKSLFTQDLTKGDLAELREVTRASYARWYPDRPPLTDGQCDTLINDLGPEAAADTLRDRDADISRVLH